ncbi:MAG: hypothetical protein OXF61_02520 [Acidimicrobiaceae bacterium]|nr:hypothetical protein [Acidimicrobiaceae bacterium]
MLLLALALVVLAGPVVLTSCMLMLLRSRPSATLAEAGDALARVLRPSQVVADPQSGEHTEIRGIKDH